MRTRFKLFTLILLIIIISISSVLPVFAASVDTSYVRVLLSTPSSSSLSFTVTGSYTLKEDTSFTVSSGNNTVSVSGGKLTLTSGGKTYTGATVTLLNNSFNGTANSIKLKNSYFDSQTFSYLGDMYFTANGSTVRAINKIDMEQYLYGVVPYEMSNTFPVEALKAQAVCARSFAIVRRTKYANSTTRAYDLIDTPTDQAYKGYVASYTRAISAVDATCGQVLTYNGAAFEAHYCASNGGQTERSGNIWVQDLPYYIHQDDPYDLKNPSSLQDLSFIPAEFNSTTIALMDSFVYNMLVKAAENATGADSVTLVSTSDVVAHTPKYPSPSRCYTMADVTMKVLPDGAAEASEITVTISIYDLEKNGIFRSILYMKGAEAGTKTSGGTTYNGFYLTNRRYGHGIGMSQRGAQQRATEGHSYTSILSFYYPGTALTAVKEKVESPNLTSNVYTISTSGIVGVAEDTPVNTFIGNISANGDSFIIVNSAGAKKTSGSIGTGDSVRVTLSNGSTEDIPIIIYGDVNGDGVIGLEDLLKLQKHLLGTTQLTGSFAIAGDVSKDSTLDVLDLLRIQKHLLGTAQIKQ